MSDATSLVAGAASCLPSSQEGMTFRSLPCFLSADNAGGIDSIGSTDSIGSIGETRLPAAGGGAGSAVERAPSIMTFGNFVGVPTHPAVFDLDQRVALDNFIADLRGLVIRRIELVACSWDEAPSVARARADAVKQYLIHHGRGGSNAIQVRANCLTEPAHISLRLSLRREVEARVHATLPTPPPRNPALWPLPPVVFKRLPRRPEDLDEGWVRRLDHAARDFVDTKVSRLEVSIISPPRGAGGGAPDDIEAYLTAVHLVKNYLVGRGLDAAMVHLKPWPGLHAVPGSAAVPAEHGILIEAWAPTPDPVPRLAFTEGYVPALSAHRRYA